MFKLSKNLNVKLREAIISVLPVTAIVLVLSFTVAPLPLGALMLFLAGAALLIIGMGLFTLGTDIAMMTMGGKVGEHLSDAKYKWAAALVCFLIGILITLAEPDLQVLANQAAFVPSTTLIITVSVGVGFFLLVAFLRLVFKIRLSLLLIISYAAVFIIAAFVPKDFLSIAFDSGGVTTGPVTVPFIMALGIGLAAKRADSENDSFGLVALCSIGPILSVLILGLLYTPTAVSSTSFDIPEITNSAELAMQFGNSFSTYAKEVAIAMIPMLAFFLIYQTIFLRLRKRVLIKISIGVLYSFVGLTLFLTGVNVGFMPAGNYFGSQIAGLPYNFIIIPIGMVIGFFIVKAEPAVHVLKKQVAELSGGAISERAMMNSLSIGMAVSVGIAMLRAITGISILYFLIPGYVIALGISFFVPKLFTAIAFDSGGVASGPMTATFLLPFAMGACEAVGGNLMTDAFGVIAMVAMTPLITIQLLGLFYSLKLRSLEKKHTALLTDEDDILITDDDSEESYE